MIRPRALVTGASSGIGAAYARALGGEGHDLVLVARRKDRLEALAAELQAKFDVLAEVLVADLALPADLRKVETRLGQGDVDMLVNNAGLGDISPFLDQQRDSHERMIAVNVLAPTRLAHAALPAMRVKGAGTIINVGSGFAFDFMPGASVYAGTKAYLVQWTHVLHAELAGEGLRFQALIPGLTRTGLGGAEETGFFDNFPAELVMEPEVLVAASLKGLQLGELVCIPRLEDEVTWASAHAAIRKCGESPPHNHVAPRYR
jgi:short-subunit dehydrogenase